MNRLPNQKRKTILRCLVDGCSMRAAARIADVHKCTVSKLLVEIGSSCLNLLKHTMTDLELRRLELDEVWTFCGCKQKNLPKAKRVGYGYGDVWTWVAIDSDTKLVPFYWVGTRSELDCKFFMQGLARAVKGKPIVISDGLKAYIETVPGSFEEVDFAQVVKQYAEGTRVFTGVDKRLIMGDVPEDEMYTSIIERQHLTMRMNMRRFTRKTNAFSKKIQNLNYALAIHYVYYNFVRIHQSIETTPAMAAGIVKDLWSIDDILDVQNSPLLKGGVS